MERNFGNTIVHGFGMVCVQMVLQENKAKLGLGYSKAGANHTKQFANNSSGNFPTCSRVVFMTQRENKPRIDRNKEGPQINEIPQEMGQTDWDKYR